MGLCKTRRSFHIVAILIVSRKNPLPKLGGKDRGYSKSTKMFYVLWMQINGGARGLPGQHETLVIEPSSPIAASMAKDTVVDATTATNAERRKKTDIKGWQNSHEARLFI